MNFFAKNVEIRNETTENFMLTKHLKWLILTRYRTF